MERWLGLSSRDSNRMYLQAVELMIAYGADPYIKCPIDGFGVGHRIRRLMTKDIQAGSEFVDKELQIVNAVDIIEIYFGSTIASQLVDKFKITGRVHLSWTAVTPILDGIPQVSDQSQMREFYHQNTQKTPWYHPRSQAMAESP